MKGLSRRVRLSPVRGILCPFADGLNLQIVISTTLLQKGGVDIFVNYPLRSPRRCGGDRAIGGTGITTSSSPPTMTTLSTMNS